MYDFKAFLHYNYLAWFKAKGQHYRLTPKRIFALAVFLLIYIPTEIIVWICFGLDEIFFPAYHQQQVKSPIFIIGNPRSGTTFTHRLIEKDRSTFTAATSWELIFCPSIIQRKIIWAIRDVLQILKVPFNKTMNEINENISFNKSAHKIKLNGSEEDEHWLIHIWSTATLYPFYPIKEPTLKHYHFDQAFPQAERLRIMGFYRRMVQKHLFAHGGDKIFLSKNPSFTAKIETLQEIFPDAKFVTLVRNPFDCMPSMMNYMASGWKLFGSPLEPYPYKEEFFEVMRHLYLYPAEYFQGQPDACMFIKYDELVRHPDEVIMDMYDWLDLPMSYRFSEILRRETRHQQNFRSKHEYDLAEMGLSEELIFREYEEVFQYYEFETHEFELPERKAWQGRGWQQNWKARRILRRERRLQRRLQRRIHRRERKGQPTTAGTAHPTHDPQRF